MKQHKDLFTIHQMCRVLGVSESGYYARAKRSPSKRTRENERLLEQIKEIFKDSRETYGMYVRHNSDVNLCA